jgi:flavin-binding protein dodecin
MRSSSRRRCDRRRQLRYAAGGLGSFRARGDAVMSVAKVIELTSTSSKSFEDAIEKGIARADKTLKNVEGAWIKEQKVVVEDGRIAGFRVNMMVTFVLEDENSD